MQDKILILIDYRNQFWLKSNYKEESFDIPHLKSQFEKYGYNVSVKNFDEIDLKTDFFENTYVIYQSSEDPNLFYKSYIEDLLWGLKLKGAILIPDIIYLRAHHNKVFMEILRDISANLSLKTLNSQYFGTYEDYCKNISTISQKPKVLKSSDGAQSKNVLLLKKQKDFIKFPKKISTSFDLYYWFIDKIKPLMPNVYPKYRIKSHNRKKFVIQDFVAGLSGDFKVLIYQNKFFVLQRSVRKNDFRASGSGNFNYVESLPEGLLNYAEQCFTSFDVPFMGLDIAYKDGNFYLIEFQFVNFGNYTLEKSPFHFIKYNDKWSILHKKTDLELEFASAVDWFIKK